MIGRQQSLSRKIRAAKTRLREKLARLSPDSSGISEYGQRYLKTRIDDAARVLDVYGRIISLCVQRSGTSMERFTFVDYGGGTGLLSFLAKEAGIGTVIYDDIYDVACADVKILSGMLGLPLDHVVTGDIDDLLAYLKRRSIRADSIASYDVLEHIYDLEVHFKKVRSLSDDRFRVVYASGANPRSRRYVRSVTKRHLSVELTTREREWGHKERDSLESYLETRKRLISSYAPELGPEQVEQLSRWTRGLIKSDIEKRVDEFRNTGTIAYRPDHPTNTCDPYTGNWCEHLIDLQRLGRVLREIGYSSKVLGGLYTVSGSLLKRSAKRLMNGAIRILGSRSLALARHFIVYAEARTA
jgi:hypothetical protein